MAQKLRYGIIGCGVIGDLHAQVVTRALNEEVQLVAVADIIPERADRFSHQYGGQAHYDYLSLLQRDDLDMVSVCLPSGMHADCTIEALNAGKHVVCEKPFDITLEAIDRALEVERNAKGRLTVIFQNRFHPASQIVKQAADTGKFGRLTYASAQIPWWRSQAYYDSGDWRGTRELDGGGSLMNQGVHTIDLMQWVMGPVVEVQAYTATLAHERIAVEDVATAALRFANGALGVIEGTTALYPGLEIRLVVGGDRGSAVLEGSNLHWFHAKEDAAEAGSYGGGQNQAQEVLARAATAQGGASGISDSRVPGAAAHVTQIKLMLEAVRHGTPVPVAASESRNAVAIILAVYESARTGRPVAVR